MIIDDAIFELKEKFSTFNDTYDGDDNIYLIYGAFGMFALDVINLFLSGQNSPQNYFYSDLKKVYKAPALLENEVKRIFLFIDKMFIENNEKINDVLNSCIFEALMGIDYSYNLASKETYNHYKELFFGGKTKILKGENVHKRP